MSPFGRCWRPRTRPVRHIRTLLLCCCILGTGVGGTRGAVRETSNALDNSTGPLFPVFLEDITADASSADRFAPQVQIAPPTPAPAKPVATIAACTLASRHACDGNLTACLIEDPTSHPSVCACFFSYGACFRSAACYDMLPRSHIAYCFETVQCDMMDCLGSRINAALAASMASGAGVAALALLLALWARA